MAENKDAYGWDDPIEEQVKVLLPEGIASFEVMKFERQRQEIQSLGGMINKAVITLMVTKDGETSTETDDLPLHSKFAWKLMKFFTSIGQREHGDTSPLIPNWGDVEGSEGFLKIKHREYTKKDGSKGKSADFNYLARGEKELDEWLDASGEDSDELEF